MYKFAVKILRLCCLLQAGLSIPAHAGAGEWTFNFDYVKNISPLQYKGDIQVWDIAQGEGEYVYFATAAGLSVWDGVRWTQYKSEYDSYLRTLLYDSRSGRIYSAGNNEFGYWLPDAYGDYVYTRLWSNDSADVVIFWRCCAAGDNIYFQGQNQVLIYNAVTGKIDDMDIVLSGRYIHTTDGKIFIQTGNALNEIVDKHLVPTGLEINDRIVYIGGKAERFILVTESLGIRLWDGRRMHTLNADTDRKLSEARVFSAEAASDGNIAVGTILDGLYIIDTAGNIVSHIDSRNGLHYTTVLSTMTDRAGRIWLGLDGGAAMVDGHSSDMYWLSAGETIGSVYTAAVFGDKLYMGTNKGLYALDRQGGLHFVPGSQGQVWNLFDAGSELLVCHDKGLCMLSENGLQPLSWPAAWRIRAYADGIRFSIDKVGISIYDLRNGQLTMRNKLTEFNESHDNGFADKYGNIWLVDYKGVPVRVRPDRALRRAESVKHYDGINFGGRLLMCSLDGEVIFYTYDNAYIYDIATDRIKRSSYYSALIALCGGRPLSLMQINNQFFYVSDGQVGIVERQDGAFFKRGSMMSEAAGMMIPRDFRTLFLLDDNTVAMGIQNGLAVHNASLSAAVPVPEIKLRKLDILSADKVIPVPCAQNSHFNIPGSHKIAGVALYFTGLTSSKTIDWRMDGEKWKTDVVEDALTIRNLSPGEHLLEVRNSGYNDPSAIFSRVLDVKSVWYRNEIFIVGLVIFAALGAILTNRLYLRRLSRRYATANRMREAQMQREKERHELELMRFDMKEKDKKLMNFTMEGINRNNMLGEIKAEMVDLRKNIDSDPDRRIKNILRHIDAHLNDRQTWELFKKYYNNIYDGFFDRLTAKHPGLTANDMKICAYLKLDLSSKEIAILMNISTSSVEIARHRLRKKLQLAKEKSLVGYIAEI